MSRILRNGGSLLSIALLFLMGYVTVSEQARNNGIEEGPREAPPKQGEKNKNGNKNGLHTGPEIGLSVIIEVSANESGEPIRGAEVFVKSQAQNKSFERTLHTNNRGIASLTNVPRGSALVQVTAKGRRSFGKYYDLKLESETIVVQLERMNSNTNRNGLPR